MEQIPEKIQHGLVSVCVPVYNAQKTLKRCIDSILKQTYENMEVILVDDGSTDSSLEICRQYAKADRRVRVVAQKNSGVSAARNAAIKASCGEYLAFADSDDWVSEDMYRLLYENAASSHSQLVFCNFVMVKGDRQIRRDQFKSISENDPQIKAKILTGMFSPSELNITGSSCTILVLKKLLSEHGISFNENIKTSEDMLFVLQCTHAAQYISVEKAFLYYYRFNQSSVTQNYIRNVWADMMVAIDWSRKSIVEEHGQDSIEYGIKASIANALFLAVCNSCKSGTPMRFRQRIRYCRKLKHQPFVRDALQVTWKRRNYFRRNLRLKVLSARLNLDCLLIFYYSLKRRTLLKGFSGNSVVEEEMNGGKKAVALYFHTGSKNHGCEAIVRSTAKILHDFDISLFSDQPEDDKFYGMDRTIRVFGTGKPIKKYDPYRFLAGFCLKIGKSAGLKCARIYKNLLSKPDFKAAISIGGDNYCYTCYQYPLFLKTLNQKLNKKGIQTVLWGCSIEPKLLEDKKIVRDLEQYSLITARESITYRALLDAHICKNTKLYPDPAFLLEARELPLPPGFEENNTVGINVSPLVTEYESEAGITFRNYCSLILYLIQSTGLQVALIPHVVEADLDMMQRLYEPFRNTGRVVMVDDHNCMELKGYISRCRMSLCARTHASIAAYSSCVPTIAVGYSVKSKGISKDIFGTYENYVIPVQSLRNDNDLVKAFRWLMQHEAPIRARLQNFMPSYCAKALESAKEIEKLTGESE